MTASIHLSQAASSPVRNITFKLLKVTFPLYIKSYEVLQKSNLCAEFVIELDLPIAIFGIIR